MSRSQRPDPFTWPLALSTLALIVLGGLTVFYGYPAFSASTQKTETASGGANTKTAIFAGGCFWCVEKDFDQVPGVLETTSGYTGGTTKNPTYKSVTYGNGGHYEAVRITYDPRQVTYDALLDIFWRSVDPTDDGGQFCDRGHSYKTAIFAKGPEQLKAARASKAKLAASKVLAEPIVTPVLKASAFTAAEDYHQNYAAKSPLQYKIYRYRCGRDARVRQVWGDQAYAGIKD